MKKSYLIILALSIWIATPIVHAQSTEAPRLINLQAVLVDEGGNVLYNQQEADIIFSIVDGAGETFYEEIQHVVLVNGAISVLVGGGNNVNTGAATGGIPIEALSPDGTKLLRVKLADQSIPQEDLQLASVPYSMYSQQAYGLVDPLAASGLIEEGTIEQVHLSSDLLKFINDSVSGVSQADLAAHKTEAGAHTADTIAVENTFINASGTNVAQILVGLDRSIGTRRNEEGVLGDAIDTEEVAREIADATHAAATSGVHGVGGGFIVGTDLPQTLTNKTLTTPLIADFSSAQHDHLDGDDGGTLNAAAITAGEIQDIHVSNTLTIGASSSVADEALSSNVTKMGASIESGEITDGTIANADISSMAAIATSKLSGLVTSIAGHGLDVWDQDASNDLTTETDFSGDLSGKYNTMAVANDSHNHNASTLDFATDPDGSGDIKSVDDRYVNTAGGDIMTGSLTMSEVNINMNSSSIVMNNPEGCTPGDAGNCNKVDGVDVSALKIEVDAIKDDFCVENPNDPLCAGSVPPPGTTPPHLFAAGTCTRREVAPLTWTLSNNFNVDNCIQHDDIGGYLALTINFTTSATDSSYIVLLTPNVSTVGNSNYNLVVTRKGSARFDVQECSFDSPVGGGCSEPGFFRRFDFVVYDY